MVYLVISMVERLPQLGVLVSDSIGKYIICTNWLNFLAG